MEIHSLKLKNNTV